MIKTILNAKVQTNVSDVQIPHRMNPSWNRLLVFLYCDAVFYAAGQQEEVLKLQSFILLQDVVLDLLQFSPELVNLLLGFPLGEVLLCVCAQRYLGKRIQKAAEDRGTNVDDVM